jgi:alpha-tubulin suppressor-like RCC1 family protein
LKLFSAEGVSGIQKVYAGESFGIFLTTEGDVYTVGCGHFGALGHGDEKAQSRPKKLEFPSKHKFVAAAGGSFHSLFITEDGKVYAAGKNDLGQCGIVGRKQFTTPTLVEALLPYHIISADCGKDHSILLTNDGTVITMGDNESGQLGIGLSDHNQPAQVRIVEFREKTDLDGKVVQVAAQAAHNLVRCESGSMFTFGAENGVWQNTLRMTAAVPVRVRVPDGVKATWVACGTNMSAFVAENGDLYTWGDTYCGKSGRTHMAYFPEVVDSVSKYCSVMKPTRVDCGSNSTIILIQ